MKNLHLIPTDKPSRLYYNGRSYKDANNTTVMDWYISSAGYKPHNIHITSDEKPKKEDWCYSLFSGKIGKVDKDYENGAISIKFGSDYTEASSIRNYLKITLTTNQDLIKDGIQAIDDEFLEWFIANPSCEEVEIYEVNGKLFAEPIIPKEKTLTLTLNKESAQGLLGCLMRTSASGTSLEVGEKIEKELVDFINDNK